MGLPAGVIYAISLESELQLISTRANERELENVLRGSEQRQRQRELIYGMNEIREMPKKKWFAQSQKGTALLEHADRKRDGKRRISSRTTYNSAPVYPD